MSLRDLKLKKFYDSDVDDILNDFYVPVLSKSVCYRRLAGFFSSTSLAIAARGISKLIANNGRMMLVASARLQEADVEAIREAYQDPESIIERLMLKELDNLEDRFVEDHVRALGWMVANKRLEIKVAIVMDEDRYPIDENVAEKLGMFHQKIGILEDGEGNKISFSGSENETAAGWLGNIEEFKVFRNWVEVEKEYLQADLEKFEKFWEGLAKRARVIDIPTAVKEKLIEIAPNDIGALNLDRWLGTKDERKIKLRGYQKEAIDNWLKHGKKGIFEMATGTGKTATALGCVNALWATDNELVTIIACPFSHLITQWIREMENFGIAVKYVIADSTNSSWRDEVANKLLDLENSIYNNLVIFTTHDTLAKDDFRKLIQTVSKNICLIVDEVHGVGAPILRQGLLDKYQYRLGLSATPKRWFDLEGTDTLLNYFGDTVFEFPLSRAIGEFLTEYEYYPYFVTLTDNEFERYEEETEKIAKAYYASKDDEEREKWFTLLCIRRQNIVKTAFNKYHALREIIANHKELKHCLIYCTAEQLEQIQKILLENNIKQHKFTEDEGTRPKTMYGEISERDYLLRQFSKGTLQVLVAIKCLDEGVDIPPATFAIMMSNSGNPREHVQRTGRILRKYPGKKISIIYDIIVIPSSGGLSNSLCSELEKKIFLKELKRYKEFSSNARNAVECLVKIEQLEENFKMGR